MLLYINKSIKMKSLKVLKKKSLKHLYTLSKEVIKFYRKCIVFCKKKLIRVKEVTNRLLLTP